jgi:hypothetical protein
MPALDAAAKAVLISVDTLEPVWCEVAHACPLIRITKDAGDAAQPIRRDRNDSVVTLHFPYLGLTKCMHGSPMIDMSSAMVAFAGIEAVGLEGCVTRAGSASQIRRY